jgi:hypothetical protein
MYYAGGGYARPAPQLHSTQPCYGYGYDTYYDDSLPTQSLRRTIALTHTTVYESPNYQRERDPAASVRQYSDVKDPAFDTRSRGRTNASIRQGARPEPPPPPHPEALWHSQQVQHTPPPDHYLRGGLTVQNIKARDDLISETETQMTSASTVGLGWRNLPGKSKAPKDRKHRTHIAPVTGRRYALVIAEDDNRGVCENTLTLVTNFLLEKKYSVEKCIHQGDDEQFRCDIECGMRELCSAAQPGDAVFIYGINLYSIDPQLQPLNVINTLAHNLRRGVQVICLFDCCDIPCQPPYRIDHRQAKLRDPKNAGLTFFRRIAQRVTQAESIQMECDLICFYGWNAIPGELATFRHGNGMELPVYTSAFVRAYNDKDNWSILNPPTLATMSKGILDKLELIRMQGCTDVVNCEIGCYKPYDIDQRMTL